MANIGNIYPPTNTKERFNENPVIPCSFSPFRAVLTTQGWTGYPFWQKHKLTDMSPL